MCAKDYLPKIISSLSRIMKCLLCIANVILDCLVRPLFSIFGWLYGEVWDLPNRGREWFSPGGAAGGEIMLASALVL